MRHPLNAHPRIVGGAVALFACSMLAPAAIAAVDDPVAPSAPRAAVPFGYLCSSTEGQTAETYLVTGSVPAEVVHGSTFSLTNVVITGTPSIDLLLDHLTVELEAPIGATALDGLSRMLPGPGSLTPPGPFAPAGQPNSTPPLTFTFSASGAVGTTVDFFTGDVSTLAREIGNPTNSLAVTCARTTAGSFASTRIVAPTTTTTTTTTAIPTTTTTAIPTTTTTTTAIPTTTTTTTAVTTTVTSRPTSLVPSAPGDQGVQVLGATAERATAVAAAPSFTG